MITLKYYDDASCEMEKLVLINSEGVEKVLAYGNYWDDHGEEMLAALVEGYESSGVPFKVERLEWDYESDPFPSF